NGGSTDKGISATEIHLASTIVTDGSGKDFLGEAQNGIQAAIDQANGAGGICGRRVTIEMRNTGWNRSTGSQYISSYVNDGKVFALVGEPDSEGLAGAIDSKVIDNAGIPVVGTDGMLSDQYHDPWVWPVSASTVTNAHIVADYARNTDHASTFGVVYDTQYRFGAEGAKAFVDEVHRLGGTAYSQGVDGSNTGTFTTETQTFNSNCKPCDAVFMLLEPTPAKAWMHLEGGSWYKHLYGGEPLFNSQFAGACGDPCGQAPLHVWTGYRPAIQPFDSQGGVPAYSNALKAKCQSCDPQNEFTEGAYLGTRMFIEAAKRLGAQGTPLTRQALADELNSDSFDLGLTDSPITYAGKPLHLANTTMAMFAENYAGGFNGWSYQNSGYVQDPSPGVNQ
ncbi:MAG TPA: ABC transporter substrate-binding protein, partial [Candidatus Dormibacteraeota bacterium]